jgi:hypothetical protein
MCFPPSQVSLSRNFPSFTCTDAKQGFCKSYPLLSSLLPSTENSPRGHLWRLSGEAQPEVRRGFLDAFYCEKSGLSEHVDGSLLSETDGVYKYFHLLIHRGKCN